MKDRRLYDQKHTSVGFYSHPKSSTVRKATEEIRWPLQSDQDPSPRSRKAKDIVHVIRMKPYLDPEEQANQRVFQACGWILAVMSGTGIIFGTLWWNKGQLPDALTSAVFASVCRPLWTAAVAWVTVMCASGHAGDHETLPFHFDEAFVCVWAYKPLNVS
ncbi:OACYL [Cordylochernes scorpioides]|uniref:OACYL n=1 Tax=Cordylochernes scorpioides TaxID=51811 RepID=A0ABY6KW38_9ARAC|nr:OACYL [Cordylochernes scorpioides]